jgi:Transposase DDE domain
MQWVKPTRMQTFVPRDSRKWRRLYRGRTAVERVNGRLKEDYGLVPLRVRGLAAVSLHVDLSMLALLASRLARVRAESVLLAS